MVAAFKERLKEINPVYVTFDTLQTLQVNLGNLCNLSCAHCHVGASPRGEQVMSREVMSKIIGFLARKTGLTLDITGGCPEMNPYFPFLIEATEGFSPRRIVRSNLTIATEPDMERLPEFYRRHRLVIIASLPCYLEENVDRVRGSGTLMIFGNGFSFAETSCAICATPARKWPICTRRRPLRTCS